MATKAEELAAEFARVKAAIEAAGKEKARIEAALIDALEAEGLGSLVIHDANGGECKQTIVAGERVKTDYDALKAKVSASVWKSITVQVVDPSLVEAAVAMKKIKAETVAEVSEVVPNKKYVKVSGNFQADTLGIEKPKRKARVKQ